MRSAPLPLWFSYTVLSPPLHSRGDDFRTDYGRIGELQAILPKCVHTMALMATATHLSCAKIIRSLRMNDPFLVYVSPHKKNIIYRIARNIGGELNLADWQIWRHTANIKSANNKCKRYRLALRWGEIVGGA